jgi:prepilin-type N-terminal cleavage/methylation domain-containing protein
MPRRLAGKQLPPVGRTALITRLVSHAPDELIKYETEPVSQYMALISDRDRRHLQGPCRGFSLIELLVAMSLPALLASFVAPSMSTFVTSRRVEDVARRMAEDMALARNEAVKRNAAVPVTGDSYTLTATPIAGSTQAADGNLTIDSSGNKTWGSKTW